MVEAGVGASPGAAVAAVGVGLSGAVSAELGVASWLGPGLTRRGRWLTSSVGVGPATRLVVSWVGRGLITPSCWLSSTVGVGVGLVAATGGGVALVPPPLISAADTQIRAGTGMR